jgi:hypothetical protein
VLVASPQTRLPAPELFERARTHGWRFSFINLYADPNFSSLYWKSEYIHFVKDDYSAGVIVNTNGSYFEVMGPKSGDGSSFAVN